MFLALRELAKPERAAAVALGACDEGVYPRAEQPAFRMVTAGLDGDLVGLLSAIS
jgi:hypothetical protein